MRDFNNAGNMNVGRDIIINDQSQNQGKLFVHCSAEELLRELPFRQENLRLERRRKMRKALPAVAAAVIIFMATSAWAQINGKNDLVSFILGNGSLFVGFVSIVAVFKPNEFELHEQKDVREIKLLLKVKRVESQ